MDWFTYIKIVDEVTQFPYLQRVMPYLMNEPLVDQEIIDKIKYLKKKIEQNRSKAMIHILTNGINLSRPLAERLILSGIDWVGISIPAILTKTYEKITGREDFGKIKENITKFIRMAIKEKGEDFILISLTRDSHYLSLKEKDEAINYWKDLGVKNVQYFGKPISRAGNVEELKIAPKKKIKGCNSIWTNEMIHIIYNGDVVPCCMDWRREIVLGNVREHLIEDIWNGNYYQEFRKKLCGELNTNSDFLCKRCEEAIGDE